MTKLPLAICLLLFPDLFFAQKTIVLNNPSFESRPAAGSPPNGWTPCGMSGETCSDIQPGLFGCNTAPAHGGSYLGMVTRDNYTWEWVSQRLSAPLDSGYCYAFTVQLAASQVYESYTRLSPTRANYNQPVVFQVWGGYADCTGYLLLGESPVITHSNWLKYRFVIRHMQRKSLSHIMFVAYYPPGKRCTPTIGNLLVDDVSPIVPTNCPSFDADTTAKSIIPFVSRIRSETALDSLLIEKLSALKYQSSGAVDVEYRCEEGYQGLVEYHNVHLLTVVAALRQFPAKKIVLHMKGSSSKILRQRADSLEKYLIKAGLDRKQVEIKPLKKSTEAKWKLETQWLNANW